VAPGSSAAAGSYARDLFLGLYIYNGGVLTGIDIAAGSALTTTLSNWSGSPSFSGTNGTPATPDIPATPDTPAVPGGGLGVVGLSLTTKASSLSALASIDSALAAVSSNRATLGATGNRLQSAISNIQAFSESLSAANSRIKDVDVAEESSRMSRSQILMQAGVSVLAQANQMPQMALKLLG
jgi:flagellin-like hook-associated protein FlgL